MKTNLTNAATLNVDERSVKLDVLTGTMGERALDMSTLKAQTGCVAFDPALTNTAVPQRHHVCGWRKGILRHRAMPSKI